MTQRERQAAMNEMVQMQEMFGDSSDTEQLLISALADVERWKELARKMQEFTDEDCKSAIGTAIQRALAEDEA